MKRKYILLVFLTIFMGMGSSLVITSCTKEGPMGPAGEDGKDGADAVATCMTCHNFSEVIVAKFAQHSNSAHASGTNINRNAAGCSHCHTSKGFRDFIADGTQAVVTEPTAINCRTCHQIHETYTAADYALRTNAAVNLTVGGKSYNYGSSNMCAQCHQARPISPMPAVGGADVTITNARFGPHYAPQANIMTASGLYEVPGSLPYVNSAHTSAVSKGCVTCHMSNPVGYLAGGHQMSVKYGDSSYNYNGCMSCHTNATTLTASMNANRTEIQTLTYQLRDLLITKGLINPTTELVIVPKTMTANEAGAIMNYKYIYGDKSKGAHNYPYVKALLTNTIEAISN